MSTRVIHVLFCTNYMFLSISVWTHGHYINMLMQYTAIFMALKILFGIRLYVPVINLSVISGRFPGLNQYYAMKMKCLAQGQNTAPMVIFEPAILRSRVRHCTY